MQPDAVRPALAAARSRSADPAAGCLRGGHTVDPRRHPRSRFRYASEGVSLPRLSRSRCPFSRTPGDAAAAPSLSSSSRGRFSRPPGPAHRPRRGEARLPHRPRRGMAWRTRRPTVEIGAPPSRPPDIRPRSTGSARPVPPTGPSDPAPDERRPPHLGIVHGMIRPFRTPGTGARQEARTRPTRTRSAGFRRRRRLRDPAFMLRGRARPLAAAHSRAA